MTVAGYARTSTTDQVAGLEDQIKVLRATGAERVFSEHVSALAPARSELDACLAWLRDGDTLMITKPDRIARSVKHLLDLADELRARGVGLRILSLDMDTSTATGRLTLTLLGAVAEWERTIMLERQKIGIAKAKLDGKYKGRAPTAMCQAPQVMDLLGKGLSNQQVADYLKMGVASVYRIKARAKALESVLV